MHTTNFSRGLAPAILATTLAFFPTLSRASGCVNEITVNIHFKKGAVCWYYAGRAEQFVGTFSRGQQVFVHMEGEGREYDGHSQIKPYWAGRSPSIEGPDKFFAMPDLNANGSAASTIRAVMPASGQYRFSFSPCAMWGGYGHVAICAR